MKKINKTPPPNALTIFAAANPNVDWDTFCRPGELVPEGYTGYEDIKKIIFDSQGWLCAYCEGKIPSNITKQKIEHFHSKSDKSNPTNNWALDWSNIFGVCLGGSDTDQKIHPLPKNLSCDSYKDHLITNGKLEIACEGIYINPLHLFAFPFLFDINKANGELRAHVANCQLITIQPNQHSTTESLVTKSIEVLNLNCDRLSKNRVKIFEELQRLQKQARMERKNNNIFMQELTEKWLKPAPYQNFFTSRRILLGQRAEDYLRANRYNG